MSKRFERGLSISETHRQSLAYVQEFKSLIHDQSKILERFLNLADQARQQKPGYKMEDKDLTVLFLGSGLVDTEGKIPSVDLSQMSEKMRLGLERNQEPASDFFQVRAKGEDFFVKMVPENLFEQPYTDYQSDGFAEILSSAEAMEKIEGLRGIEVNKFYFAFKTKKYSIFVSKWRNLPKLNHYLINLPKDERAVVGARLEDRLAEARLRLEAFNSEEINSNNCFYDSDKDNIVLFDLHKITKKPPQE